MKLTLGFSPCPNDCFMFEALVSRRIPMSGIEFGVVMEDVEQLNRRASGNGPDVTKLSYAAFSGLTDRYVLLPSGSALGAGCGPLLVSGKNLTETDIETGKYSIAIPGERTTANYLFSMRFPDAKNKQSMIFSSVEEAVQSGRADAGVIIHENRFTYEKKGLKKVLDLGDWWEKETGLLIPLGCIAAKRTLPREVLLKISDLISDSIRFAYANPDVVMPYVKAHAAEMDEEVMKKHIELYVNKYSISLGIEGTRAVTAFLEKAMGRPLQPGVILD